LRVKYYSLNPLKMEKKNVVNVEAATHKSLKAYCKRKGLKIQFFVEGLINEAIKLDPPTKGKTNAKG